MASHDADDVWFPASLPELPTFPEPPPLTISGEDLARMVPPMPTVDIDFSRELVSSDEESEAEEVEAQSLCKQSRPRSKKRLTKTKAVAQKPPRKQDSTRGREQKKRAASAQAKKAATAPRKKGTKKAGS